MREGYRVSKKTIIPLECPPIRHAFKIKNKTIPASSCYSAAIVLFFIIFILFF